MTGMEAGQSLCVRRNERDGGGGGENKTDGNIGQEVMDEERMTGKCEEIRETQVGRSV